MRREDHFRPFFSWLSDLEREVARRTQAVPLFSGITHWVRRATSRPRYDRPEQKGRKGYSRPIPTPTPTYSHIHHS
ncbi:hypothetical protein, partial [Thermus scotoductus]|uniref:hypothetical protein n=1 Tax=Thermus scotoductus TaxID=37636 RepID=UPI001C129B27